MKATIYHRGLYSSVCSTTRKKNTDRHIHVQSHEECGMLWRYWGHALQNDLKLLGYLVSLFHLSALMAHWASVVSQRHTFSHTQRERGGDGEGRNIDRESLRILKPSICFINWSINYWHNVHELLKTIDMPIPIKFDCKQQCTGKECRFAHVHRTYINKCVLPQHTA